LCAQADDDIPAPRPAPPAAIALRDLLHARLFSCGWRASHSLVEVYRLAGVGIDQADRL
jgi:hypothetical protein